jgi:hypothetical protein
LSKSLGVIMDPLLIFIYLAVLAAIVISSIVGVWQIARFLFKSVFGFGPLEVEVDPREKDLAAARRVVDRMVRDRLLTLDQSRTFRSAIEQSAAVIQRERRVEKVPAQEPAMTMQARETSLPMPAREPILVATIVEDPKTKPQTSESVDVVIATKTPATGTTDLEPAAATENISLAQNAVSAAAPTVAVRPAKTLLAPPRQALPAVPPKPVAVAPRIPSRPMSEVLSSFMIDHNIRVVEIVAGLLIVICSIGLVVSLWNTLVSTHRAVPSLIFMAANAAIYFAGFYTFTKWQLTQASRTVLIIATLLVPLGVLAGMAATGSDPTAVRLTDPVTLIVIVIGMALNLFLVHRAGLVLVGRSRMIDWMLSVAAPAALLPLLPTLVRWLGDQSGWVVAVPAVAIAVAWLHRSGVGVNVIQSSTAHGFANTKSADRRGLTLALTIGAYGLLIVVGSLMMHHHVFALVSTRLEYSLPIAIVLLPVLIVGYLAWRRDADLRGDGATSVLAKTISIGSLAASFAMLPAMLSSAGWTSAWSIVFAVTSIVLGYRFNRPGLGVTGTAVVPLSLMMLAPTYAGGLPWVEGRWLSRLFGDESIVYASLYAVTAGILGRKLLDPAWKSGYSKSAVAFTVFASALCLGWAFQPIDAFRALPWFAPSAVLVIVAAALIYASRQDQRLQWLAVGMTSVAVISTLRLVIVPLQSSLPWISIENLEVASVQRWSIGLCTLLPLWMALDRWWKTSEKSFTWPTAQSANLLTGLPLISIETYKFFGDAAPSWLVLCAVTIAWIDGSLRRDSIVWSFAARVATLITTMAVAMSYGWDVRQWTVPISADHWMQLATGLGTAAIFWCLLRFVPTWQQKRCLLSDLDQSKTFSTDPMVWASGLALIAAALTLWIAGYSAAGDWSIKWMPHVTPISAAIGSIVVLVMFVVERISIERKIPSEQWMRRPELQLWLAVIWAIASIGIGFSIEAKPLNQLIIATTGLSIGWVAGASVSRWRHGATTAMAGSTLAIAGVSAMVFRTDWLPAVLDQRLASLEPTMFVTGLVSLIAVGLIAMAIRQSKSEFARAASPLLMVASVVAVPAIKVVHPGVWIQIAGIVALVIAIAMKYVTPANFKEKLADARRDSQVIGTFIGVVSAILMTASVYIESYQFEFLLNWPGYVIAIAGVVLATCSREFGGYRLTIPMAVAVSAGPILGIAETCHLIDSRQWSIGILGIWNVAVALAITFWTRRDRAISLGNLGLIYAIVGLSSFSAIVYVGRLHDGLALLNIAMIWIGAGWLMLVDTIDKTRVLLVRGLCSAGLIVGTMLVATQFSLNDEWSFTAGVLWFIVPVLGWRAVRWIQTTTYQPALSPTPDRTVAYLVFGLAIIEVMRILFSRELSLPLFEASLVRMVAYLAFALTVTARVQPQALWKSSIGTVLSVAILAVLWSAHQFNAGDRSFDLSITLMALAVAMVMTVITSGLGRLQLWDRKQWVNRGLMEVPNSAVKAGTFWTVLGLLICLMIGGFQWIAHSDRPFIIMSLAASGLMVAAVGRLADRFEMGSMRSIAVVGGIATLLVLAAIGAPVQTHPVLIVAMRWVVLSVILIPMFVWGLPWLFGEAGAVRWESSMRLGRILSLTIAIIAGVVMFAMEATVRRDGVIAGLPDASVIGMGIVLGILTMISAGLALATRPGTATARRLQLSDNSRRGLIVAAQALGGLTYAHKFFCRQPWATFGMAPHWPYVVFALAMLSVGVVYWSRRKGDELMASTLQHTSLFLPLVPLIGFWAKGGPLDGDWNMFGEKVGYQTVLMLFGFYYLAVSSFIRKSETRVFSFVLGVGALWLHLADNIGWGFLSHPQAWMLPPAVGLLILTHLERQRLEPAVASGLRYSSTLVIYITSTADMLFTGLGSDLQGPIMLIILSLVGIAAGMVMRIRPFLYLGTLFILIATTSMVFHAGRSMDAVWPWWVFGITTGILILGGLVAIEKNRPMIKSWLGQLATWS